MVEETHLICYGDWMLWFVAQLNIFVLYFLAPDSCVMAPSQPAKSPRCSQQGSELQDRLRLLLDVDSKENLDNRYCRTARVRLLSI